MGNLGIKGIKPLWANQKEAVKIMETPLSLKDLEKRVLGNTSKHPKLVMPKVRMKV
jgi:hypothetical protein